MVRIGGIPTFGYLDKIPGYNELYGYPTSPDAVTGIPNRSGQGDIRDAFRHVYASTLFTYKLGASTTQKLGEAIEIFGNNPKFLRDMDISNNALGIEMGENLQTELAGANLTTSEIEDLIALRTHQALLAGKSTFYVTGDLDNFYTQPWDMPTAEDIGSYDVSGWDDYYNYDDGYYDDEALMEDENSGLLGSIGSSLSALASLFSAL